MRTEGAPTVIPMLLTLAPRRRASRIEPHPLIDLLTASEGSAGELGETMELNHFEVRRQTLTCGPLRMEPARPRPAAIVVALVGARGANLLAATVCRQIRANDALVPIVCISEQASAGSRAQVLDAGADDVLTVGLDDVEFISRLRAHVRRNTAIEARVGDFATVLGCSRDGRLTLLEAAN